MFELSGGLGLFQLVLKTDYPNLNLMDAVNYLEAISSELKDFCVSDISDVCKYNPAWKKRHSVSLL